MAYDPTIWKDRVVEKPRTYCVQNNPDGTITLIPAPGEVYEEGTPVNALNLNKLEQGLKTHEAEKATDAELGHVIVDGDTIQTDEDGVISVPVEKFMSASKVTGYNTYTDSIAAGDAITKNIPIGESKKFGMCTLRSTSTFKTGALIFFSTNNLDTLACGPGDSSNIQPAAWARRDVGYVVGGAMNNYGITTTGDTVIGIQDLYINGTNLSIVFKNFSTTYEGSLNCRIDWEVW